MLRSILLGLLALGTIPIALADATATSNTEFIEIEKPTEKLGNNLGLVSSCASKRILSPFVIKNDLAADRFSDCSSFGNISSLEVNSELWFNNITDILLSGSMFEGCRTKESKNYSIFNNSQRSLKNLVTPRCLFSWQQPNHNQESQNSLDSAAIELFSDDNSFPSYSDSSVSPSPRPKFPKLSRTSLIVSPPTKNSSFVPDTTKLANPAPDTKRIASPFGWRTRPYSYQLQFHQGIDYGAPLGSPVVAVRDGIVTKVVSGCYDFGNLFCGGQLGNWIEIDHGNGALGIYGHLKNSSIAVEEGMKVWKNQEIAQVGSSGWSTGAHLDFRFKVNGKYEDPAKYVMAIEEQAGEAGKAEEAGKAGKAEEAGKAGKAEEAGEAGEAEEAEGVN